MLSRKSELFRVPRSTTSTYRDSGARAMFSLRRGWKMRPRLNPPENISHETPTIQSLREPLPCEIEFRHIAILPQKNTTRTRAKRREFSIYLRNCPHFPRPERIYARDAPFVKKKQEEREREENILRIKPPTAKIIECKVTRFYLQNNAQSHR